MAFRETATFFALLPTNSQQVLQVTLSDYSMSCRSEIDWLKHEFVAASMNCLVCKMNTHEQLKLWLQKSISLFAN